MDIMGNVMAVKLEDDKMTKGGIMIPGGAKNDHLRKGIVMIVGNGEEIQKVDSIHPGATVLMMGINPQSMPAVPGMDGCSFIPMECVLASYPVLPEILEMLDNASQAFNESIENDPLSKELPPASECKGQDGACERNYIDVTRQLPAPQEEEK